MELINKNELGGKSIILNEKFQLTILFLSIFGVPFFLKSPQYIIGTMVNLLLILSVTKFGLRKMFPALILPSLATYLSGKIFGGATNFLLYIIPFIILSNLIYVSIYQRVKTGFLNAVVASAVKSVFLFVVTYTLYKTIGLPSLFLTTMSITQLLTAFSGGIIGYLLLNRK